MKSAKTSSAVFLFVMAVAAGAFLWRCSVRSNAARIELLSAYEAIAIGDDSTNVARLFSSGYPHLKLRMNWQEYAIAQTPLEWGAQNWQMWIHFRTGVVAAVAIRLQDDVNIRPSGAPPDKGALPNNK
jgi:hypothetical protein